MNPDEINIQELKQMVSQLSTQGRFAELLKVIGVPTLQHLNIEAAKARLSRLVITPDYRFLLPEYGKELDLTPIHKSLYILFLNHPEGIEFKQLQDHRAELIEIYRRMCNRVTSRTIENSIDRLINPLDNSVNEKCARIKSAFASLMDAYQLSYYAISSHTVRHIDGSSRVWFERKKTITLPRELVVYEAEIKN